MTPSNYAQTNNSFLSNTDNNVHHNTVIMATHKQLISTIGPATAIDSSQLQKQDEPAPPQGERPQ